MIQQPQKIDYSVETTAAGMQILNIEGFRYALGGMVTSDGLALAHQLQRIMAPLASQAVQGEGKTTQLDMESVILSLSIGLNELTPAQFVDFCRFSLGPVTIMTGKDAAGATKATAVFDNWFADKLHHVGILIAHVAVAAGAIRFFLGLVAAMNTLSPAQKSTSDSPPDSTGSSSKSP